MSAQLVRVRVRGLSSGELARRVGFTKRQLSNYRRTGLLVPSRVTRGGHSRYLPQDVTRARLLAVLCAGGVSIQASRRLLPELVGLVEELLVEQRRGAIEGVSRANVNR